MSEEKVKVEDILKAGETTYEEAVAKHKANTPASAVPSSNGLAFLVLKPTRWTEGCNAIRLISYFMAQAPSQHRHHKLGAWTLNDTNKGFCLFYELTDPLLMYRFVGHQAMSAKLSQEYGIESIVDIVQF